MTYAEKLRDPRWQKKRLRILERDGFTCQRCRADHRELQVHHKRYFKGQELWDINDEFLTTVCNECHQEATDCQETFRKLFGDLHISDFCGLAGMIRTCWKNDYSSSSIANHLKDSLLDPVHNPYVPLKQSPSDPDDDPDNPF